MTKKYRPWLKAFSGLSINVSSALIVLPFIGTTVSFPKNIMDLVVLTVDIGFAILFMLISVWCEKELEK